MSTATSVLQKTADGRKPILDDAYAEVATWAHQKKGGGTVTVNEANHATTLLGDRRVFLGVVPAPGEITYGEPSGGLTSSVDFDPSS